METTRLRSSLLNRFKPLSIGRKGAFEVDGQPHPHPSSQWGRSTPPSALPALPPPQVLFNPPSAAVNRGCQFPTLSGWMDVNGRCLVKARPVVGAVEQAQKRGGGA